MSKSIITSAPDSFSVFLRKIWSFRSLIWVFAIRDIKVKYAQTSLGVAWSIIQPLIALLIFTFFFGYLLDMDSGELPYSLHVLTGLLGWNFFTYTLSSGSNSIQESSALIRKIYFPKAVLPFSKVLVAGVEMLISSMLLLPLMFYFDFPLSPNVIFLPIVWLFNIACALVVVFWLGAFAIRNRDLYHLVPFLTYFGIWLTPVFFTADLLPEKVRFLIDYNPMANVVELWRWSLFGTGEIDITVGVNFALTLIFAAAGMYVFNRRENSLSDY